MKCFEGLDEYQASALKTAANLQEGNSQSLAVCGLGVAGEAGEVADYIKKVIGHGHLLERDKLVKELGDVLWYVAVLARVIGADLSEVATVNIEKLKARYPDGFSTEASVKRVDVALNATDIIKKALDGSPDLGTDVSSDASKKLIGVLSDYEEVGDPRNIRFRQPRLLPRAKLSIRSLTPLHGKTPKRRFAVYDLEWEPHNYRLGIVGLHDGKTYSYFTSIADFLAYVLTDQWNGFLFFAHWGGIADTLFLFRTLYDLELKVRIVMNNSAAAIIVVTKGDSSWTFVDSSFLFRVALAEILSWRGKKKGGEDELTWDVKFPVEGESWDPEVWAAYKKYNMLDCAELWGALEEFQDIANGLGARMGLTMSSTAMDLLRRKHLTRPIVTPEAVNDFAMFGYYASRVEDYKQRLENDEWREMPIRDTSGKVTLQKTRNWGERFDANSMFVSAMVEPLPGSPLREYQGSLDNVLSLLSRHVLFMAEVTVKVPSMYLPPLPFRQGMRLYFPTGTWTAVYTSVDIELALEMGCEILAVSKIIEFETRYDFKSYAESVYSQRLAAPKGSFLNSSLKLLGNGCYGKTTECEEKEEFWMRPESTWCETHFDPQGYCLKHDSGACAECTEECNCIRQVTPGLFAAKIHKKLDHRQVQIGAFIVSYARRTLYRFQYAHQRTLAYSDTDCGHVAQSVEAKWIAKPVDVALQDGSTARIDFSTLGDFKPEGLCSHMLYLAPKVYGGRDEKGDPILHAKGFRLGKKVYWKKQANGCPKHENGDCSCKVHSQESVDRFYAISRGEPMFDSHMVRPKEYLKTIGARHPVTRKPLVSKLRDVQVGHNGKRLQLKMRPKRACACGNGKSHAAVHCGFDANLTRPWSVEELNQPWENAE